MRDGGGRPPGPGRGGGPGSGRPGSGKPGSGKPGAGRSGSARRGPRPTGRPQRPDGTDRPARPVPRPRPASGGPGGDPKAGRDGTRAAPTGAAAKAPRPKAGAARTGAAKAGAAKDGKASPAGRPGPKGRPPGGRTGGRVGGRSGGPPGPPSRPPAMLRLGNPRRRISLGLIGMACVLSLFAGRLVQLQGLDAKVYEAKATEQRLQPEKLPARRGRITDARGRPLATTIDARVVFVDPAKVDPDKREQVASTLSRALGKPVDDVSAALARTKDRYVEIATGVTPSVAERIRGHGFAGVGVKSEYARLYPGDDLAGSLIGFVGDDGTGLTGIEAAYNSVLTGRDGQQSVETGAFGQRIPMTRNSRVAPVDGGEVRLTIDQDIQWAAQKAIAAQVKKTRAESGSVIVMDGRTGELLAVANAPELNLGEWRESSPEQYRNRAVSEIFEPGSTNKVITAAAAIESGVVRPDTVLQVKDNIRCADRVIRDSEPHPMEPLTFTGVLAESSNVGTIMVADRIGEKSLYDALRAFGFGRRTGSGVPGEEAGLLPKWDTWSGSQRCTVAFGQGLSVTALQMTSVYQTIANGGVRITPKVVAAVRKPGGELTATPAGKRTRVVSERTAKEVARMLEAATSGEGTGTRADIEGYRVAGKTGTAQRYDQRCGGYCGYTASFVGFAPADAPRLVVLAVLQAPENGHFGGEIAAPVFKDVMTFALKTRKVPPTGTTPPPVRLRGDQ